MCALPRRFEKEEQKQQESKSTKIHSDRKRSFDGHELTDDFIERKKANKRIVIVRVRTWVWLAKCQLLALDGDEALTARWNVECLQRVVVTNAAPSIKNFLCVRAYIIIDDKDR